jgi:hypothetical protein
VEGNFGDEMYTYQSPFSFFVAEMQKLLHIMRYTIVLTHFCGMQVQDFRRRFGDARDMLASLLGQLLQQWDDHAFGQPNVRKTDFEAKEDDLEKWKISPLGQVLRTLVLQIPAPWTIFFLVDAIDMYETGEKVRRTMQAMDYLISLVHGANSNGQVVVKLMVLTPGISTAVGGLFTKELRISLPEAFDDNQREVDDLGEIYMTG